MTSLFLNTFCNYLHIALIKDNKLVDQVYESFGRDLSKMALVKCKELLERNGLGPNDVENLYVVEGPGSFTGLRVGVTIAKTYAWGLNKDLYALSSLFVMATSLDDYDYVIPLIDARRGYVFAGIYDNKGDIVLNDQYISLKDIILKSKELKGKVAFVSNDLFTDINVIKYVPNLDRTFSMLKCKKVNAFNFVPNYLKKTEAEENRENDKGSK